MKIRTLLVLIIVSLVFVIAADASAHPAQLPTFDSPILPGDPPAPGSVPSLMDVINGLAQAVGLGTILSFLFERFAWFQNLRGEQRWWVICGLSVGLPVLAQVAIQFVPAEVWALIEPYWQSLASGFLAFFASQVAHMLQQMLSWGSTSARR